MIWRRMKLIYHFVIRYQFVPQMIFLNSLFGYLSLLIVIKWCTGSQADLYHVMIYMFLSPTDDLGENQLFWGQRPLQACFLILFQLINFWLVILLYIQLKNIYVLADPVINFGYSGGSMDALSKTFYFEEASYRGTVNYKCRSVIFPSSF